MPGTRQPRPYHHGDLRRGLIEAALVLLRLEGPQGLTLRAVARAAGVSEAAPYRHFSGRAALIAAVAEQGFTRMRAQLLEAVMSPVGPGHTERAALQQLGLAYLRFALEHPAEYRVMFGAELAALPPGTLSASYHAQSGGTLALLREGIARLQASGSVRAGDTNAMATSAWALMHGLAMLALDGQVTLSPAEAERVATTATTLLMHGMAEPAKSSGGRDSP